MRKGESAEVLDNWQLSKIGNMNNIHITVIEKINVVLSVVSNSNIKYLSFFIYL